MASEDGAATEKALRRTESQALPEIEQASTAQTDAVAPVTEKLG